MVAMVPMLAASVMTIPDDTEPAVSRRWRCSVDTGNADKVCPYTHSLTHWLCTVDRLEDPVVGSSRTPPPHSGDDRLEDPVVGCLRTPHNGQVRGPRGGLLEDTSATKDKASRDCIGSIHTSRRCVVGSVLQGSP